MGDSRRTRDVRILAVSYLFPSQAQPNHGIFVWNRIKAMSDYYDVRVINPVPWFPFRHLLKRYRRTAGIPREEVRDGVVVYHPRFFSIPGFAKWLEAISYRDAVRKVVESVGDEFDFDLIDLHWTYPDLPAGEYLRRRYNKSMCCTLRGMEAFHFRQGRIRERLIRRGLRAADKLIALSRELKDTADTITGRPDKSVVIPNGVDVAAFRYVARQNARDSLGLLESPECKIILGVGSLIRRKGFDRVIEVLPELLRSFPQLKYYVIGSEGPEGDYRKELMRKVSEHSLERNVVFFGAVDNSTLRHWYNAADVFCLSSRGEGSPNVLSEALACGCPTVAFAVGASAELMEMAGQPQNIVPADNEVHLDSYLERVLKGSWERSALSAAYHEYDWGWCAARVAAELEPLVRRQPLGSERV